MSNEMKEKIYELIERPKFFSIILILIGSWIGVIWLLNDLDYQQAYQTRYVSDYWLFKLEKCLWVLMYEGLIKSICIVLFGSIGLFIYKGSKFKLFCGITLLLIGVWNIGLPFLFFPIKHTLSAFFEESDFFGYFIGFRSLFEAIFYINFGYLIICHHIDKLKQKK